MDILKPLQEEENSNITGSNLTEPKQFEEKMNNVNKEVHNLEYVNLHLCVLHQLHKFLGPLDLLPWHVFGRSVCFKVKGKNLDIFGLLDHFLKD